MKKNRMLLAGILSGMILSGVFAAPAVTSAAITDGKVLVQNMDWSPDSYIFSDSHLRELSDQEIQGLDGAGRQMAINEIYARRGRKFVIPEVQSYFAGKNWYSGTVEAADFDENIFNEYEEKNIARLLKNSGSDYLLEGSDSCYLSEEELRGLTREELQLGINEIYARRGRKFSMEKYREYFSGKSWYNGTIEPDSFDEKVFNDYESTNIQKLTAAMNAIDANRNQLIQDMAGTYVLDKEGVGVVLELSVYTDRPITQATTGEEVAMLASHVRIGSGGISTTQSYVYKEGNNQYSIYGGDLMGANFTVLSNGIEVTGIGALDGTYTLTERY